jgi:branched-chain amino acid transport system ATP-binding protein
MPPELLVVDGLVAGYGEDTVLHDVGFTIPPGGSLAVLGRNGAGKSTLLLTLMGHLRARRGSIVMRGAELTREQPHRRVAAGIGWVPEGRDVFRSCTVDEHLAIAARPGAWNRDRVYELFPRLSERRCNFGDQLSGGEQQMLALGRALMTNPVLLLLDEPLEGLAPVVVAEVAASIRRLIADEGTAIVLVEQHARFALENTQHAIVLERGRIVHRGASTELAADEALLDRLIGMRRLHQPAPTETPDTP